MSDKLDYVIGQSEVIYDLSEMADHFNCEFNSSFQVIQSNMNKNSLVNEFLNNTAVIYTTK